MNDEIKEILDYFQKDVDKYEESKRYLMQKYGYDEETIDNISQHERHINTKKILDYITNLQQELIKFQEFKEEHKIMKQILIENGLWERLLNDDRFLKYLRNDEDEQ